MPEEEESFILSPALIILTPQYTLQSQCLLSPNTVEYVQAVADRVKDHIESELGSWEYVYAEAKAESDKEKEEERQRDLEWKKKWDAMTDEEQLEAIPF